MDELFYYLISNFDESKFIKFDLLQKTNMDWRYKGKTKRFTKEKAQNLMISNLTKMNCKLYKTDELINKPLQHNIGMCESIEVLSNKSDNECSDAPLQHSISLILDVLDDLPNKLSNEKLRLENEQIKCSRALTDIAHYLEFTIKISASDRCKLSTLESDIYRKRREIKDNILRVEYAMKKLGGSKDVLKLDDRLYEPREMDKLFNSKKIMTFNEWWNKED